MSASGHPVVVACTGRRRCSRRRPSPARARRHAQAAAARSALGRARPRSCSSRRARAVTARGAAAPSRDRRSSTSARPPPSFQLTTGRMPLTDPSAQPVRKPPAFPRREIDALVAYVASLGDGPPIPDVDPAAGDLSRGRHALPAELRGVPQHDGRRRRAELRRRRAVAPRRRHRSRSREAMRTGPRPDAGLRARHVLASTR